MGDSWQVFVRPDTRKRAFHAPNGFGVRKPFGLRPRRGRYGATSYGFALLLIAQSKSSAIPA